MFQKQKNNYTFFNRELSWLSFNGRVLQEAEDESVPIIERLRFLAIFSSNLDEYYSVRIASLKSIIKLKKKENLKAGNTSKKLLKQIYKVVHQQQVLFGHIFRNIITHLQQFGVFIHDEKKIPSHLIPEYKLVFQNEILPHLKLDLLTENQNPFFENKRIYLFISYLDSAQQGQEKYALLNIPHQESKRFFMLKHDGAFHVLLLEDIIRLNINELLKEKITGMYAFKISRDAELYIEDEFSGDLVEKIKTNLKNRSTGLPTRFLFDSQMPLHILQYIQQRFSIDEDDLVAGGKYHNFKDFFGFPNPENLLPEYPSISPLNVSAFEKYSSAFDAISHSDILLHYPYQDYNYVIDFFELAAKDSQVQNIKISLYRVAENSRIAQALILAAKNGKSVTVFMEVKARFDEAGNIYWADELKKAGAVVLYSIPGLKVHAKICLITRMESNGVQKYAYFSSGNFNEKTAKIYTDIGFFTTNKALTSDLSKVFRLLSGYMDEQHFEKLQVAPDFLRSGLYALIDFEIAQAQCGNSSLIQLKLNSLEDKNIIKKLYEASNAGVQIQLIVRGICCLIPGIKNQSENISIVSIVGRFLEHSRIYYFLHQGEEKIFVSSADWMKRNLSHRIEVAFPIENIAFKQLLKSELSLFLQDNQKARIINDVQSNLFKLPENQKPITAQEELFTLLSSFHNN